MGFECVKFGWGFPAFGPLILQKSHLCLEVVHLSEASAFKKDIKRSINHLALTLHREMLSFENLA